MLTALFLKCMRLKCCIADFHQQTQKLSKDRNISGDGEKKAEIFLNKVRWLMPTVSVTQEAGERPVWADSETLVLK